MAERPGRYNRTFGGLVGSMIVCVVVVLAFVAFRALGREELKVEPEAVEYLPLVVEAQAADLPVLYPTEMPAGWTATSVNLRGGTDPTWHLGILTDDGDYVGLRQESTPLESLAESMIDEDYTEGDPVTVESAAGSEWTTYADAGGDHGFGITRSTSSLENVLVYGSASEEEQRILIGLLTDRPAD